MPRRHPPSQTGVPLFLYFQRLQCLFSSKMFPTLTFFTFRCCISPFPLEFIWLFPNHGSALRKCRTFFCAAQLSRRRLTLNVHHPTSRFYCTVSCRRRGPLLYAIADRREVWEQQKRARIGEEHKVIEERKASCLSLCEPRRNVVRLGDE